MDVKMMMIIFEYSNIKILEYLKDMNKFIERHSLARMTKTRARRLLSRRKNGWYFIECVMISQSKC